MGLRHYDFLAIWGHLYAGRPPLAYSTMCRVQRADAPLTPTIDLPDWFAVQHSRTTLGIVRFGAVADFGQQQACYNVSYGHYYGSPRMQDLY